MREEILCDSVVTKKSQSPSSLPTFFRHELFVVGGREQAIQLIRVFQSEFEHPGAMRVFVDFLRRGRQFAVDFSNRAGGWRVEVGNRLDRFDRAEGFPR